jgi:hypothetical protein
MRRALIGQTAGRRRGVVGLAGMVAFMIALPGVAQASQAHSESVARSAQPAAVVMSGASSAVSQARSSWVQADCGWVTCTIRLDRASTRNARDAAWLISAAGAFCAFAGPGAAVCAAAIIPPAVTLAVAAGRYYENGNCLGIRFSKPPIPSVAWPTEVKHGSYNCN